jgi:hypothetical protein
MLTKGKSVGIICHDPQIPDLFADLGMNKIGDGRIFEIDDLEPQTTPFKTSYRDNLHGASSLPAYCLRKSGNSHTSSEAK